MLKSRRTMLMVSLFIFVSWRCFSRDQKTAHASSTTWCESAGAGTSETDRRSGKFECSSRERASATGLLAVTYYSPAVKVCWMVPLLLGHPVANATTTNLISRRLLWPAPSLPLPSSARSWRSWRLTTWTSSREGESSLMMERRRQTGD